MSTDEEMVATNAALYAAGTRPPAEEGPVPDPDGVVYVVMSPRRFVTELVIYAGPADRAVELTELAEAHCPRTGHVYQIDGRTASMLLYARPDQAFGHQHGEDWGEDWYAIRLPWRDRLVARCVAAMDERAASRRPPGRPPVGRPINTRLDDAQLVEVDARASALGVTRAEMIRRLVEAGMREGGPPFLGDGSPNPSRG